MALFSLKTAVIALLVVLFLGSIAAVPHAPKNTDDDSRFTAPKIHYDLPVSIPDPNTMTLETVQVYSRHGNRAADPIVEALCPKRKVLTDLYREQQASYGALTYNGIRSLWDLGRFTHETYVKTGFISGTYTRATSQIRAAASDRTLISANAFSQTTFRDPYANSPFPIPAAVLTSEPEEDNLLEVRKARCAPRLAYDLKIFDTEIAEDFIAKHSHLIEMISGACGFDIMHGPQLTNGEFSVMQLVKDLSDALTGDLLEQFPLMEGVTPETRQEFLQFAESIFKRRHYRTMEMDSYLAGNAPNRIMKLFDRRVSFNTNTTVFENLDLYRNKDLSSDKDAITYRDIVVQDSKRLPIIRPRAPRRFFAYHAHREVLYGLKNFLHLDVGVERPGLPTGLIHPGTGMFFELWQNHTATDRLLNRAGKEGILPVLDPNRSNRKRFLTNQVDEGYYLRIVLWVPCFEGMTAVSGLDKTPIEFIKKDEATGEDLCMGRVRTLPQCDNLEFCPLSRVKQIVADNFNEANGDFRAHCPVTPLAETSVPFTKEQIKTKPFKSKAVEWKLADFFHLDDDSSSEQDSDIVVISETKPVTQDNNFTTNKAKRQNLAKQMKEERDYDFDHDSDSFESDYTPQKGNKSKRLRRISKGGNSKRRKTNGAGIVFNESSEEKYNNMDKATWANNLATFKQKSKNQPKPHQKRDEDSDSV